MKEGEPIGVRRAEELARQFDRSFAEPVRTIADESENLLALRAGRDDVLVRLAETKGLVGKPVIVPLPGPVPELLGIAGLRGSLVPIYSLAALLGQTAPDEVPGWVILVEADGLVGLAFEELAGYVQVHRREIASLPPDDGRGSGTGVREAARMNDGLRGIISVPSLVAALKQRVGGVGAHKED